MEKQKEQMDLESSNKLIAEFMGFKLNTTIGDAVYYNEKTCRVLDPSKLLYHCDWNWLMPVVEKIVNTLELGYFNIDAVWNDIHKHEWKVLWCNNGKSYKSKLITGFEQLIEATWLACVEFIKWYNSCQKETI